MRDLFDSIKDLKDLAANELDGRQRVLILDAIWNVVKSNPTGVVTDLGRGALSKWTQFKTAPLRRKFQGTRPALSLKTIGASLKAAVHGAKEELEEIKERGPLNVIKDAASSVSSALGSANTVRAGISDLVKTFVASEHKGAEAQRQVATALKTVGFAALILLDRVQRAEGPAKDGATELVDGVTKILSLHPEVLALTAVTQLATSVARRAMAFVPPEEPAHKFFDESLKLYDTVSEMGLEYVLSLKIEGLHDDADFIHVTDDGGRTLLRVPRTGDAEERAFAAARRMCGPSDEAPAMDDDAAAHPLT